MNQDAFWTKKDNANSSHNVREVLIEVIEGQDNLYTSLRRMKRTVQIK